VHASPRTCHCNPTFMLAMCCAVGPPTHCDVIPLTKPSLGMLTSPNHDWNPGSSEHVPGLKLLHCYRQVFFCVQDTAFNGKCVYVSINTLLALRLRSLPNNGHHCMPLSLMPTHSASQPTVRLSSLVVPLSLQLMSVPQIYSSAVVFRPQQHNCHEQPCLAPT
jgi:hypothetical protein